MALTVICGFESGALIADGRGSVSATGATSDTVTVRSGTYSCKIVTTSGVSNFCNLGSIGSGNFKRFYILVTSRPASTARVIFGAGGANDNLRLNPDGTLAAYTADGVLQGTSTTALTDTARWYRIDTDGTSNASKFYVDGELISFAVSWAPITSFGTNAETVADAYTAYFDDFAQGTSLIGAGNAVLLLPTSLSAANGWVEGDGAGTANMAAAVSTRPPPGLASANETNATNIESATNSATDDCDMNCTDYTTAGVSGTVNGVQAIVRHGEDIATATKAGAVTIVSNPAQVGEDSFNFGDDAGAHGAEAGNWKTKFGTLQAAPSVTLGTSPVLRVGKRTATTRVVCVDFMGIYVDYTPSTTRALPLPQPSNFQNPAVF